MIDRRPFINPYQLSYTFINPFQLKHFNPAAQRRSALARLPTGIEGLCKRGLPCLQERLLPTTSFMGKVAGRAIATAAEAAESAAQEKDAAEYGSGDQAKKEHFHEGNQKDGGEEQTEKEPCGTHG